jgi:hypothetical protein
MKAKKIFQGLQLYFALKDLEAHWSEDRENSLELRSGGTLTFLSRGELSVHLEMRELELRSVVRLYLRRRLV